MHFPEWITDEYFGQLTAESKIPVRNRRTNVTRHLWVKNQDRNEALDLAAYAHATLWLLQKKIAPGRTATLRQFMPRLWRCAARRMSGQALRRGFFPPDSNSNRDLRP